MRIQVNLNDPHFSESQSDIFFAIYWEHDNTFYPEENWSDFGIRLLSFWTSTIKELVEQNHKESVFNFMDGPYRIQAQYDGKTHNVKLFLERDYIIWETRIDIIINELIRAIEKVYIELKQKNKLSEYKDGLKKLSAILNRCLSKVEAV